jgi:hypothetical protein
MEKRVIKIAQVFHVSIGKHCGACVGLPSSELMLATCLARWWVSLTAGG